MQTQNYTVLHGDCLERLKELPDNSIDAIVTDPPYGISFMGKKWDYDVPKCDVWREVLRVLKPGGHCLVACGTRTQDLMALGLRFVGFEIRDCIAWVYGSGFPKSLDIGKAIDKAAGAEREIVGIKSDPRYLSPRNRGFGADANSNTLSGHGEDHPAAQLTAPATEAAKQWDGWGTALKPSIELWTLCRKPLSEKTVAENVLTWGTGGLNIDACRVGTEGSISARFPANLIHDGSDEVTAGFPQCKSGSSGIGSSTKFGGVFGTGKTITSAFRAADKGSAARFFYCAKASKSERNAGIDTDKNHHPTVKPLALMRYLCRLITPPNGTVLDPFTGSGSTGCGAVLEGFNFVGIEREEEYANIARARIAHHAKTINTDTQQSELF